MLNVRPDQPRGLADLRGSPKDVARWLFWVQLRSALDPERPEQLARLYPLWRAQHAVARGQRALMADEYTRWRGEAPASLVERAYQVSFRVHLEELLLGKLTTANWERWMVLEGQENLERALSRQKGAVLLFPHAGNFMFMHAIMGLLGYRYTQYAARGMAPPEVASAHAEVFANNKWRREARAAREGNEDRLPIDFISLDTPVRHLYRCLARNELVGIAFDGRIGAKWVKAPYLGRTALLSPGPYRLVASTGAALVPVFVSTPEGERGRCTIGEPFDGRDADTLMHRFLGEHVGPWLGEHPEEYGTWLAHCRERAGVDDHPFFTDYAPGDRWKAWDRG